MSGLRRRKPPGPLRQGFVVPIARRSSEASAKEEGKTHTGRQKQSKAISFWQFGPDNFIGGKYGST